jgi:hypothetical protein
MDTDSLLLIMDIRRLVASFPLNRQDIIGSMPEMIAEEKAM